MNLKQEITKQTKNLTIEKMVKFMKICDQVSQKFNFGHFLAP